MKPSFALFQAWIARIRNAHPDHHAIARGMVWVGLFVIFGKFAGAAKEMAVAYRYGVSSEVDAYLFVYNLVYWPVGIWFSILTIVLVPLIACIRQESLAELPWFQSELFGLSLLIGLTFALLGWLGLPLILHSSWTGLPSGTTSAAINMVPALALLAPLGIVTCLFSARMLAVGQHANTLLEGVPALVIMVAVLAYPWGGIGPLVWGTLGGFILHMISLALPLARKDGIELPRFTRQSPHWSAFWHGFGIMMAGQTLMSFNIIVDQFFAAHLSTGAIATLSYANRILSLILGLGATAVSRASLPVFSAAQAQQKGQQHLHHIAVRWMRLLFLFGIAAIAMGWLLAPWIVKLLFEHGAFTAQNSINVTEVLRYGLLQVPFYFSGLLLVSYVSSLRLYPLLFATGLIGVLIKLAANAALIPIAGVKGITLATAAVYAVNMLFLWISTEKLKWKD